MRTTIAILIFAAALLADGPAFIVPDDPDATILSLRYEGPDDGNGKKIPWIEILADGRIRVRDPGAGDGLLRGRIDPGIVQDVLHEVVGRQRIFDWDLKRVEAAMRKAAGPGKALLPVEDAATTILRVRLAGRAIEVRQHAVQTAAGLYPDIIELRRLLAASRRLDLEANILRAGGRGAVVQVIGVANPKLEAGGDDRLLVAELSDARRRQDGTVLMTFRRKTPRGLLEIEGELDGRGAPIASLKDHRKRYALPAEGVVLSLDYRGGYGPRRAVEDPYMTVLADGTVFVRNVYVKGEVVRGKLADARLQDLLHFVVTEQRFLEWDQAKVNALLQKQGGPFVADASTTVVRVRLRDKERTAAVTALVHCAGRKPVIAELPRLVLTERRLKRLMNIVRAGGDARARDLLELANAALRKRDATVPPLALDDLEFAVRRPDGLFLSFRRSRRGKEFTAVSVLVPLKGNPVVHADVTQTPR